MAYDCQQVFTDKEGETRRYNEMWMGEVEDPGKTNFTITC